MINLSISQVKKLRLKTCMQTTQSHTAAKDNRVKIQAPSQEEKQLTPDAGWRKFETKVPGAWWKGEGLSKSQT